MSSLLLVILVGVALVAFGLWLALTIAGLFVHVLGWALVVIGVLFVLQHIGRHRGPREPIV